MLDPSFDYLVKIVGSKYKLVVGASKRAKALDRGEPTLLSHPTSSSSLDIALQEIAQGLVIIK